MRGRKPVPTALKIVRGNPGKRALPENEPEPTPGADAPAWLSDAAREHWPVVAEQLLKANVLTEMDAPALALYCEAFARWQEAQAGIMKFGIVAPGQKGTLVPSPYVAVANASMAQMMKLLAEFGMTPSSRSRVGVAKPKTPENKFAGLVKAKR